MTKVTTADLVRYHLTGERVIGIDGSVKRIVRQNNEDEDMSEDEQIKTEKDAQTIVDEANKTVEEMAKKKETDVMTV